MKTALTISVLLLAGCANTKKVTTTHEVKNDTTITTQRDTAAKVTTVQANKSLELQDVTLHIEFANHDTATVKQKALVQKKSGQSVIAEALAELNPLHSQIVSVDAHIGDIREVDSFTRKTDSQGVKTSEKKQIVHQDTAIKTKESRWTWPLWLTLLCVAVVLAAILAILNKFKFL